MGSIDRNKQILQSELQIHGAMGAPALAQAAQISQPTLSRLIQDMDSDLVRAGKARSTRYALKRNSPQFNAENPIYEISEDGKVIHSATLVALYAKQWFLKVESGSQLTSFMKGDYADGLLLDLPWFVQDVRPQGFLGRIFAQSQSTKLSPNPDPHLWNADDIWSVLLQYGHDLSGNFVVGGASLQQYMSSRSIPSIPHLERQNAYTKYASDVLEGAETYSLTAGEQPKFSAKVSDHDGQIRHVIVKFSPRLSSEIGRRWGDLLLAEHLALTTLSEVGYPTAQSEIIEAGDRIFLESTRFDRIGEHGRRMMFSLFSLNSALYEGRERSWLQTAERLLSDEWINENDAKNLKIFWHFGSLIANSDMHHDNVSLLVQDTKLCLAPAYDMLPMLYAPVNNELIQRQFNPAYPAPIELPHWSKAAELALLFWEKVQNDSQISEVFKTIAHDNLKIIESRKDEVRGTARSSDPF